jgi:hypothetical protein
MPLSVAAVGQYAISARSPTIGYPQNRFYLIMSELKGRKMGSCRSGAMTSLALFMSGTIHNGAPPGMPPIGNWWYKEPMLWIVILLIIGIIVLKARQHK